MDGVRSITRPRGLAKPDHLQYREGSGGTVEIWDIVVWSERRQGIGRSMVEELFTACRSVGVRRVYAIARAENRIAGEFYEAMGFRSVPLFDFYGVRDEHGRSTVDAIMYVRDLEKL